MAAYNGNLVLIKSGTDVLSSAKTNTLSINNSFVEISTKKDNGVKRYLAGGGITEMTLNVDGIVEGDAAEKVLLTAARTRAELALTLTDGNGDEYAGNWFITNFTKTSPAGEAVTYSASIINSGAITFTEVSAQPFHLPTES